MQKKKKSTNSQMAYEAWAAKYRSLLKVVDIWVKSLPLVLKHNFTRPPWGKKQGSFLRRWAYPNQKFTSTRAWMRLYYSKRSRQLQLSFYKPGPVCCCGESLCQPAAHMPVCSWLRCFGSCLLSSLFLSCHKASECHRQSISAAQPVATDRHHEHQTDCDPERGNEKPNKPALLITFKTV